MQKYMEIDGEQFKHCFSCNDYKPLDEYYPVKGRVSTYCIECQKVKDMVVYHNTKVLQKNPGYIYIITNPAWKGWVKIGMTKNKPDQRLVVYQTSCPFRDYKIEWFQWVDNTTCIERHFRKQSNTSYEWHQLSVKDAINQIKNII